MKDMQSMLGKLLAEAEACELISAHATNMGMRAAFARLALQFRAMAKELQGAMAKQRNSPNSSGP